MVRRFLYALAFIPVALAQRDAAPELKTATHHPIQYYVSLPRGWTAQKKWPVVVAIESANRQFARTAAAFADACKELPFIIVVPLVVTNGGSGYRTVPTYHYSDTVWNQIDAAPFRFDSEGIAAAVADVKSLYGGEDRFFLTGWEAGGHTVWAMLFQHPEALRASAPVDTNYAARWTDAFSTAPSRADLPVKVFLAEGLPAPLMGQIASAKDTAKAHGYRNVSDAMVKKPHGPMPDEVLAWFASLL